MSNLKTTAANLKKKAEALEIMAIIEEKVESYNGIELFLRPETGDDGNTKTGLYVGIDSKMHKSFEIKNRAGFVKDFLALITKYTTKSTRDV